MSLIIDTVTSFLPPKRKATPSGWISFNAVCCHYNSTSADTRQRGGIMITEGVSYHCFNCGFKASWQPGRQITTKFKKLLQWINVPDDLINKCSLEALRLKEDSTYTSTVSTIPTFIDKALPLGSKSIAEWLKNPPSDLMPVLEYMLSRNLYVEDYPFYWTDEDGFQNRLIIPFFYQKRVVGYTARLIRDGKVKYISEQQPGYVFNLDRQTHDRKFTIVTEGPVDAICVDGCAIMSNEASVQQIALLNQLQREIVVIPDRDKAGLKLAAQAIENGWSVSMPEWPEDCKDVNDVMRKHGKLYTLWSIVSSKESMPLKIQLRMKKWIG
jgi:nitrogen fixation protein